MIFGILMLIVALAISGVAAYYSIVGLTAIFAAAAVPIIVMGITLEFGKISATLWIHKYWTRAPIQFKLYLVPAILVLMLITSMGIFGFLSKAHMDQSVPTGDVYAQVQLIDDKIKTEQDSINTNKKALQQLDAQVDQTLSRTTDSKGAIRASQLRKAQSSERKQLLNDIAATQTTITALKNEKAPLASTARKADAEVGPIKYIAALIYGDNPDSNLLERAVRWVIILLVFVFDPLAIILLLAADQTFIWIKEDKLLSLKNIKFDDEAFPTNNPPPSKNDADLFAKYTDEPPPLIDDDWGWYENNANIAPHEFDTAEEFFERGKEIATQLDVQVPIEATNLPSYMDDPWVGIPVPPYEEAVPTIEERPINSSYRPSIALDIPPDIAVGFGINFPNNPSKGDMFIRTDSNPTRVYKWNDAQWIEIDKTLTDQYSYNDAYIKYLVSKLQSGEYEYEYLTQSETNQIAEYLKNEVN